MCHLLYYVGLATCGWMKSHKVESMVGTLRTAFIQQNSRMLSFFSYNTLCVEWDKTLGFPVTETGSTELIISNGLAARGLCLLL